MNPLEKKATSLLESAGIEVNGTRPWDMRIRNRDLLGRVMKGGSLALGESYMDGWWDAEDLDEFFNKILLAKLDEKVTGVNGLLLLTQATLTNMQGGKRSYVVGKTHYDTGNFLFSKMLDKRMTYSCGYWNGQARNLDDAQEAKLDLICKKLGLEKGMTLLDIGCGWGSLAKYAAEKYEVKVTGITVSQEQLEFGKESCKGLPVHLQYFDYKNLRGMSFDRIASVGMFEHVGYKNYRQFMEVASRALKEDGLFLLHTIGSNTSQRNGDPWLEKYIFPNGMLPSLQQVMKASEGIFVTEDLHNFGADYDPTLMAWHANFNKNWEEISATRKYDERFFRMWNYYLLSLAGSFRARKNQLWQFVFSKDGVEGGYESVR